MTALRCKWGVIVTLGKSKSFREVICTLSDRNKCLCCTQIRMIVMFRVKVNRQYRMQIEAMFHNYNFSSFIHLSDVQLQCALPVHSQGTKNKILLQSDNSFLVKQFSCLSVYYIALGKTIICFFFLFSESLQLFRKTIFIRYYILAYNNI